MLIHYCWFGKKNKPPIVLKCIDSWRRLHPYAKIIEWNEDNFNVECCAYVKKAYDEGKWAFVSDYCRYYVLYHFGGIYLDTDVELIRSLNGLPLSFVGFEFGASVVNSGLIRGAEAGDKVCALMLASYEEDCFVFPDGTLNLRTVCDRETKILLKYGLKLENKVQTICKTIVYPEDYFCPYNYLTGRNVLTKNTYSIHHFAASWLTKKEREILELTRRLSVVMPSALARSLAVFFKSIQHDGLHTTCVKILKKLFPPPSRSAVM